MVGDDGKEGKRVESKNYTRLEKTFLQVEGKEPAEKERPIWESEWITTNSEVLKKIIEVMAYEVSLKSVRLFCKV